MRHGVRSSFTLIAAALIAIATIAGCTIIYQPGTGLMPSGDLRVELTWDRTDVDLDLYLTYPDPQTTTVNPAAVPVYTSIRDAYDAPLAGNVGFFPEDANRRARVYQDADRSADNNVRYSSVRTTKEVITVLDIPFNYGSLTLPQSFTTSPVTANALPQGRDYAWVGVMEVYVFGRSGTVSGAGNPAVSIYDNAGERIAQFAVTEETHIKGLSIARIPVFRTTDGRNYYQILLDKQLILDTTGIRSVAPADSDYVVIGLEGREDR
jgi:hypothetical protein